MIPKNITEQNVLQALLDIDANGIRYPLTKSKKFDLVYNGKKYPPKYTISIANEFANKEYLTHKAFNSFEAQSYLKALSPSFLIEEKKEADPVQELLEKYKVHIKLNKLEDEIYKWNLIAQFKGRPDLNASDFYNEIKSIDYRNLIYPVGISVIHNLAKERPEPYQACFKVLFDETKSLGERIKLFNLETLKVYRELFPEEKFSHHHDERTMATFLTYFNPDKYTFFKDSFYQKYCKLIGLPTKKKGDKYVHYLELIEELIIEYINDDKELLDFISGLIPSGSYQDNNHKLLAQDVLYQMLDKRIGAERSYWRIGSSDQTTNYWDFMKANGKICIGWSELGDLDDAAVKSKKDVEKLLKKEGFYPSDNRTLSRKAGEIFNFYNSIKIGDVVLAQDGVEIKGIGIVSDDYSYNYNDGFAHQKGISWKIESPDFLNSEGLRTTVYEISDNKLINQIDSLLEDNQTNLTRVKEPKKMDKILNQILFGPPGTGKTYSTINKALEIIGESIEGKTRKEIKDLFDARIKEGQIVFTTFHQSMSYEDFIEGIKPIEPKEEGQAISYKIIDGIFKRASAIAAYNCYKLFNKSKSQPEKFSFDDLYEAFIESIQEQISNNKPPVYNTLRGRDVEVKEINSNDSIIARAKNSIAKSSAPLTKENMQKLYDRFKTIEEIEDLKQVQETVQVTPRITEFYAVFSGLKQFEKNFMPDERLIIESNEIDAIDFEEIQKKFNAGVFKEAIKSFGKNAEPVILIIDEINRGNISQIFGELITLIEEDKRLGNEEELEAILPYSKVKFGVPPNLYIVGTMNTADRSVEALDAALRRRFSFEEMPPNSALIATDGKLKAQNGFLGSNDLPLLLNTINKRIEKLLDKDHQIGHSYFMSVSSLSELKAAFQNKIIPLLQEYFFGDFGKIGLVLGKGFFEAEERHEENLFADFDDYDSSEFSERTIYKIKDIVRMSELDFNKAINTLLKK